MDSPLPPDEGALVGVEAGWFGIATVEAHIRPVPVPVRPLPAGQSQNTLLTKIATPVFSGRKARRTSGGTRDAKSGAAPHSHSK